METLLNLSKWFILTIMELTVESLTQILEEELENSFEVKDKKALHRSVLLLVENVVSREKHDLEFRTLRTEIGEVKSDIKILAETMKLGFEAVDKRFTLMTVFLSIGFTVILGAITIFNFV
ncbi:MAG: hypothetical protein AB1798_03205 [Spirochaetota bacterium]